MPAFEKPRIVSGHELERLRGDTAVDVRDVYESQIAELQRIQDPSGQATPKPANPSDVWVYYPRRNCLLHCVDEAAFFMLRTNRNREIITTKSQETLKNATVGVAGMSVGSGIAIGLMYAGISRRIKIADFDTLDTSNLNRLRESVLDVGRPKVDLAAERIYELDPFADVHIYSDGLNETNLDDFFSDPKLDIVVDEIDDFKMKVRLRSYARQYRIPLLMFTSLGDNILVDVERYDLNPDQQFFNGALGDDGEEILSKAEITQDEIQRYAIQVVRPEYIPTAALRSVLEVGRTLVGRPQLYSTIAVDGGLATYLIRQLILDGQPAAGRYFVKFAELLGIDSQELSDTDERKALFSRLRG